MSDAQRRAIRSFLQIGFVQAVLVLYNAFAEADLTADQVSAITLVATPLLVLGQNWLEDSGAIPALGKAPASAGAHPVPDSVPRLEDHTPEP